MTTIVIARFEMTPLIATLLPVGAVADIRLLAVDAHWSSTDGAFVSVAASSSSSSLVHVLHRFVDGSTMTHQCCTDAPTQLVTLGGERVAALTPRAGLLLWCARAPTTSMRCYAARGVALRHLPASPDAAGSLALLVLLRERGVVDVLVDRGDDGPRRVAQLSSGRWRDEVRAAVDVCARVSNRRSPQMPTLLDCWRDDSALGVVVASGCRARRFVGRHDASTSFRRSARDATASTLPVRDVVASARAGGVLWTVGGSLHRRVCGTDRRRFRRRPPLATRHAWRSPRAAAARRTGRRALCAA